MSEEEVDELDWEEWDPKKLSFVDHMMAGSFAGLAEHVAIFPMDTLKTNIQCEKCGSNSPFKTLNCARRIITNDGIFRLWRGVGAMFAGCIPGIITFVVFCSPTDIILLVHSTCCLF
jgi:solute carrier family 25 iron transporter 28/37